MNLCLACQDLYLTTNADLLSLLMLSRVWYFKKVCSSVFPTEISIGLMLVSDDKHGARNTKNSVHQINEPSASY